MCGAHQLLPCGSKSRRDYNRVKALPAGWVQAPTPHGAKLHVGMDVGAERSIVQGEVMKVAMRNSGIWIRFVFAKGAGVPRSIHREAGILKLGTK